MLITICYSVLTWIQSRQRREVLAWVTECCLSRDNASLLLVRERLLYASQEHLGPKARSSSTSDLLNGWDSSRNNSYAYHPSVSPSSTLRRDASLSANNSTTSTPIRSSSNCRRSPDAQSLTGSLKQVSELCYNSVGVQRIRLLWEEDEIRALVLAPQQIVELHDWTAFVGTIIEPLKSEEAEERTFYILLEAEPGVTQDKSVYRKFSQYGHITAWNCGYELALVLRSGLDQLVDLMYIFRLGQIILDGGWRVFRLTTISCEGTIGTLISNNGIPPSKVSLTPGDLRRLSAGIFECRTDTPTVGISHDTSKHDITKISEESLADETAKNETEAEDQVELYKLPNWYERSPKKRSIATIHHAERPVPGRRKGSLSTLSQKSSSFASLLFCSKSLSVDEELVDGARRLSPAGTPDREPSKSFKSIGLLPSVTRQSCDSLNSSLDPNPGSVYGVGGSQVYLPTTLPLAATNVRTMSLSTSAVHAPGSVGSGLRIKSPHRIGKPPNILLLGDDGKWREKVASVLKTMLASDRYAIYDIRWDQLAVGGWADQTALLVVSGGIVDPAHVPLLLQFLGDGGRLFAWCCETPPFGLPLPQPDPSIKSALNYASGQTQPLPVTGTGWGTAKDNSSTPSKFQRILETNDSEGYSRPLTASVFAKTKETNQTVIIELDGGALGGKAVLSQVHFEESMNEESSVALLSILLSKNLGMDCTRIKPPEYTVGYLLGDHKKISEFLSCLPATVEQSELTLEFIPRGGKGSAPTHHRFPIHSLQCPPSFSTLDYFENLKTRELGRLAIYTEVITTVMNVLTGNSLSQHGLLVIARRQTAGKGRRKNVWLSPEGSALFAVQLRISLESGMGRRLSLLQHLAALSVILAVPNHKELNLRVKWPNDIYLNEQKIGGILVESCIDARTCVVNIGIGVNVSNTYPTVCLNGALPKPLSVETLIAKTLTQMEGLLDSVEKGTLDPFLGLYVENWIHSLEDEVNVEVSEGKFTTCRLSGIDDYGFLRVTESSSGHVFSVQPDGNSFDIANRLIAIKQ